MDWKYLLAYITGTVDQELLVRNEYLVTENRILRNQIKGRVRLSDGERKALAEIAQKLGNSVAERSLPLWNLVEMLCQPRAQVLLHRGRQLQDQLDKAQGLKDFKGAPSVHNNMRALGTQLLKGKGLARLVSKSCPGRRVGKQMIQAIA